MSLDQATVKSILANEGMDIPTGQSTLSVVVASHYPDALTRRCIDGLLQQAKREADIIVVRDQTMAGYDALKSSYPGMIWIGTDARTVPELRLIGCQASTAEYVAFIEDDCIVSEDWFETLLRHHRSGISVVGGSLVADDYDSPVDWAMFLCEYGRFTGAVAKKVISLSGNNASYKRSLLLDHLDSFSQDKGIYDVFLNGSLTRLGIDLYFDTEMSVKNINRWSMRNLTIGALHHGRCYADMRLQKASLVWRLGYAVLTPLLPVLLMLRLFSAVCKGRYLLQYILCIPQVCLFYTSWAAGEYLGSVFGPGDSASYWS
jgi:hypothetical protein